MQLRYGRSTILPTVRRERQKRRNRSECHRERKLTPCKRPSLEISNRCMYLDAKRLPLAGDRGPNELAPAAAISETAVEPAQVTKRQTRIPPPLTRIHRFDPRRPTRVAAPQQARR